MPTILDSKTHRAENTYTPSENPRSLCAHMRILVTEDDVPLADFFWTLEDDDARPRVLNELDDILGTELMNRHSEWRSGSEKLDPKAACRRAGVWFDVPWVPTFEGMDELIGESHRGYPVPISEIFPIN